MYYIYGISGPSLLIESTDSMIHRILPKISPAPFLAVDMAQAYILICTTRLEYKPPPADGFAYRLFSAYIMLVYRSYGVYNIYSCFDLQHGSKKRHYNPAVDSVILAGQTDS